MRSLGICLGLITQCLESVYKIFQGRIVDIGYTLLDGVVEALEAQVRFGGALVEFGDMLAASLALLLSPIENAGENGFEPFGLENLALKMIRDQIVIGFIHEQCRRFLADRERQLPEMALGDMKTCTDMQDYMVNWPQKALRKTVQFRAITTSCLDTGYVLACHQQIDTRFSTIEVQEKIIDCGAGANNVESPFLTIPHLS